MVVSAPRPPMANNSSSLENSVVLQLPADILEHVILPQMDIVSLSRMACTCSRIKSLVYMDTVWRIKFRQLEINSLELENRFGGAYGLYSNFHVVYYAIIKGSKIDFSPPFGAKEGIVIAKAKETPYLQEGLFVTNDGVFKYQAQGYSYQQSRTIVGLFLTGLCDELVAQSHSIFKKYGFCDELVRLRLVPPERVAAYAFDQLRQMSLAPGTHLSYYTHRRAVCWRYKHRVHMRFENACLCAKPPPKFIPNLPIFYSEKKQFLEHLWSKYVKPSQKTTIYSGHIILKSDHFDISLLREEDGSAVGDILSLPHGSRLRFVYELQYRCTEKGTCTSKGCDARRVQKQLEQQRR